MSRRLLILLTSVICLFSFSTALFAAANDCDRACLKTALDQYLTAVTTHKPSAAPLFAGFRQTENAVVIPMGSGVWKSVTALGKVQRHYLDPVSGNAAYYGTVEEGATSAVVTVRVRVEDHKITEAEWYIARENDPGLNGPRQPGQAPPNLFNPDGLATAPPPDRVLPKASRASREMLIAVTNSYFDGITSHDSAIVMVGSSLHPWSELQLGDGCEEEFRGFRGRAESAGSSSQSVGSGACLHCRDRDPVFG